MVDCFESKVKESNPVTIIDWKQFLKPLFTLCENTDEIIASLDIEDDDNLKISIIRKKFANSTISTAIPFQEEFMVRKKHHRFTDGHVKNVGKRLSDMNIQHFKLRQSFVAALCQWQLQQEHSLN